MEGKEARPFSSSSTQEQSPDDALQVSDQFSSLLQTNFDLDSPAFSHSDHSFAFQQQQPPTKASLSTPEAYWSECAERALAEDGRPEAGHGKVTPIGGGLASTSCPGAQVWALRGGTARAETPSTAHSPVMERVSHSLTAL